MSLNEWILLIILSILWGGSFFFVKLALKEIPPLTIVLCRVFIAAIILNIISVFSGFKFSDLIKHWKSFLIMGLLNNVIPFSFITLGQTEIAAGLASILISTTPLFAFIFAHSLTKDEKLTTKKSIGVILGILGVSLMIGIDSIKGLSNGVIGESLCLIASFSYAMAGIFGKRLKGIPTLLTATGQVTMSTILLIPIALFIDHPLALKMPNLTSLLSVLSLGVFSTTLAYLIYFKLLQKSGATNTLLVTYLIPISALLLGIEVLHEVIETQHYLGMFLIILGLISIDGRIFNLIRPNKN
ncbi:MAG: DMT family transporter [Candidatus Sericytochromatia bacterium]|nr:DMT family transporter [Candidatus Sericytochromatia bacterium]